MKAYAYGNEVIVLEFRDTKKYGPEARVVFKVHGTDGISFWMPTNKIMIQ